MFDNDTPNEKEKIVVDKHGIIALTDKRDNQTYAVARLADNNCWTIENLRLDHEYTVGQNQNDSSVTNASLAQGYGGTTGVYGNFIGLAEPDPANAFGYTTSNSIYKSSADPPIDTFNPTAGTLEDISTASNPANRFPRYSRVNTSDLVDSTSYVMNYNNATSPTNDPSSGYYRTQNVYSYGNYYSWNAAMATTNHYVNPSSQDSNGKTSETVGTSLCPTGWHLPSSQNSTKEWGALSYNYGGSGGNQASTGELVSRRFRAFPNNIVYSGFAGNDAIGSRGGSGRYWSRSTYNSTNAYNLSISQLNLSPSEHYAKQHGYSIRCLIAP